MTATIAVPPAAPVVHSTGDKFLTGFEIFFRRTFLSLLILFLAPIIVILLWYTHAHLDGSFLALFERFYERGFFVTVYIDAWRPVAFGSPIAWKIIGGFVALQIMLDIAVPGKKYNGPVTPKGNVPHYKNNGLAVYLITMTLFAVFGLYLRVFDPAVVYDQFGYLLGAANLLGVVFAFFLYIKGSYFPSSSDVYPTGNLAFDYYYGVELYPRILGVDVKLMTNCRFGMMIWPLIILSFAAKQHQLHGALSDSMAVSILLQLVYITKFFNWESGYMWTLDIMHDRAGFYICWGCIAFLPSVYTTAPLYLVARPIHLGTPLATAITVAGLACIYLNKNADDQRQAARAAADRGEEYPILGAPAKFVEAVYVGADGKKKRSRLLRSGHWGVARHLNYTWELLAAFLWCCPAAFGHGLPYFYWYFLFVCLVDRALRDDRRCRAKYIVGWEEYCKFVPYQFVPFFF